MTTLIKKIKDKDWAFNLLTDKRYEKLNGDDSDGITYTDQKYVDFRKSSLNMKVILHELFHVYNKMSLTDSMDVDRHGQEELGCEIFAEHGLEILNLALEIDTFFRHSQKKDGNKRRK